MGLIANVAEGAAAVIVYYRALWLMLVRKGSYDDLRVVCRAPRVPFWAKYGRTKDSGGTPMTPEEEERLFTAVWLQSLALTLQLWSEPHYRAASLRDDLVANFSNIAFPGTGLPMSWVCYNKFTVLCYFIFLHPFVILCEAIAVSRSAQHARGRSGGRIFSDELLAPQHWFALWRINSTLVAAHHHAHGNKPAVQQEYKYENKWDFLELALRQQGLPSEAPRFKVTPIISNVRELVCKHKNIEGGMGIHIFKNAAKGGDWILQQRLYNCDELRALLPEDAPLSTFRVITMHDPTAESFEDRHVPMTFVWRAGRAGKSTDHSSVLFAVDPDTLRIRDGKAFSNWYQVGKPGLSSLLSKAQIRAHPDTKRELSGIELSCARPAVDMCVEAHRRLMPNVPAIGWDIAVADGHGAVLLEANLSCNFFGGVYDRQRYLQIVDTYYANGCRPGPVHADRDDGSESGRNTSSDGVTDEVASQQTVPRAARAGSAAPPSA